MVKISIKSLFLLKISSPFNNVLKLVGYTFSKAYKIHITEEENETLAELISKQEQLYNLKLLDSFHLRKHFWVIFKDSLKNCSKTLDIQILINNKMQLNTSIKQDSKLHICTFQRSESVIVV